MTAPASAAERSFVLAVEGSRVSGEGVHAQGNTRILRVQQGDRIELIWSSAAALQLHLHGYDRIVDVPAGGRATMVVEATASGRFPVALHSPDGHGGHSHRTILYLEVMPP